MLTLESKIGQMMIVGFHGLEPPAYILDWLAAGRIGGVILFARNVATPAQVADLTQACHAAAARPILIAIDQEGGVVARLRQGFTESPGAMALGAADSPQLAEAVSAVLGAEMRAVGINWNLAPAIDLTHNIHNPSVGVRSLGTDPERVKVLAVAQVRGFQGAGVAATAKHFPGKADTPIDPHVSLPVIEGSLDSMWDTDLVPFRAVSEAGIAAMMITHVQFKALEPDYPSTLSRRIIHGLLREEMGFEGVISTDCMEMKAVTNQYGPGESAVLAAQAGANIILFSHTRDNQEVAYAALLDAARSGRLPDYQIEESVARVQSMAAQFAVTQPPALNTIRSAHHLAITADAARAGTVLLQQESGVLPLKPHDTRRIALIEFASVLESDVLERGGETGFASQLRDQLANVEIVSLNPAAPTEETLSRARTLAASADIVIVATRNAHLSETQRTLAQEFLDAGQQTILVCLRNPYDAGGLTLTGTVICTCGDSAPSLAAAVDSLTGRHWPTARLPVSLIMT